MTDTFERSKEKELSPKNSFVAFLLCLLFGVLGAHRFYVGRTGSGFLWLFSGGLILVGWIYDLFKIIFGSFRDKQGRPICRPFCPKKTART